ncbi:MAG: phage portal protein [Arcanobacterium sp.]|nr:phage portal protein [Arcanobacterium sp.]
MSFETLLQQAESSISDANYNDRYNGMNQLTALGVAIPPNVRALEMNVNWDRLTVDTMSEVLTVDGFESATMTGENISRIWQVWQSCNMKTLSHLAHTEAMTQGIAYAIVGMDHRQKIVTNIRPKDNIAVITDRFGHVQEAVVKYVTDTPDGEQVATATYYAPGVRESYRDESGMWVRVNDGADDYARILDVVPVVPVVNMMRLGDTMGRSEIDLVSAYTDAASRSFTLLQLATEILAMPQRWIIGGDLSKFRRPDGSIPDIGEIYMGSFLQIGKQDAKVGQFDGANLSQVIDVLKHCAEMVSAVTGIPGSMLGLNTGNPASAEAMRAAKERMISRGEFKQDVFGDAWETWARIVLALSGIAVAPDDTLSAVWRDIAVPSNSAKSAYLLQAHAQGVISSRTARDGLPLTPEQRAREDNTHDEATLVGAPSPVMEDMGDV